MEYVEYMICKEFGWTYTELEEQPAYRIDQLLLFMEREAVFRKTQEK